MNVLVNQAMKVQSIEQLCLLENLGSELPVACEKNFITSVNTTKN